VKDLLSGIPSRTPSSSHPSPSPLGQYAQWVRKADDRFVLNIGDQNWPMPIPLVHEGRRLVLRHAAGKEEILNRRIGEDELNAIGVCRAYVQAQREYASEDRDGSGVLKYAQLDQEHARVQGRPLLAGGGRRGPEPLRAARGRGPRRGLRREDGRGPAAALQGLPFRILTAQGPSAPGGAYSYVINGNMIAGFALVAYPGALG
jgi:hypothetical protein